MSEDIDDINFKWNNFLEQHTKEVKFREFRLNKEELKKHTEKFRCFLKLIPNKTIYSKHCDKKIPRKYLGVFGYKDGLPFFNNKKADEYYDYTVDKCLFIEKDKDIESTMKLIYMNFGCDLEEEDIDIVLEILNTIFL